MEQQPMVKQVIEHADRYSIELSRGMKGQYGWTIKIYGDKIDQTVLDLKALDNRLREEFGGEQNE